MNQGEEGLNNSNKILGLEWRPIVCKDTKRGPPPDQPDLDLTSTLIHTVDRSGRYLGVVVVGWEVSCVRVCVEKLNVHALFEATEREEKLNHACANVNWLCTVQ